MSSKLGEDIPSHGLRRCSKGNLCFLYVANETENWWEMTRRQMETEGQVIVWGTFKETFLQKYFPADL
ncbi:hypothetical protein Lal_00033760 [Lupinus albus]|nr:hypothetical protein Lal_00033760 [Lupinus albus]